MAGGKASTALALVLAAMLAAALQAQAWAGVAIARGDEYLLDLRPPETKILKGPKKRTHKRQTRIRFGSSEPAGASFVCSLDGNPPHPCESPERLRVGRGKHRFEVRAVDAAGNVDPTPAERKWRVKRSGNG